MKRQEARDAKNLEEPSEELDRDVSEVLAVAIEVHRILGPGFLESVYERALCGVQDIQDALSVRVNVNRPRMGTMSTAAVASCPWEPPFRRRVNPRAYLHLATKLILEGWPQAKLRDLLPDRLAIAHQDLLLTDGALRSPLLGLLATPPATAR